jgi:halimadienyl-diphosphate synthase
LSKTENRKENNPRLENQYLAELRLLIRQFGQQGGLISPSVYDTAQVLRLAPVEEQRAGVVAWLLAQQQADSGWGPTAASSARDLPTLAAALPLRAQPGSKQEQDASEAGFAFLRRNAWEK